MKKESTTENMNTLADCVNKLTSDGFTSNFKVDENGLLSVETEKHYSPEQVHIINFFRFEGASDPGDNSILYAIETDDGTKGTLTDAYGTYDDPEVGKFIEQVEDIAKKTPNRKH